MNKSNFFITIIIILSCVLIISLVLFFTLNSNGKINQGAFRVNDAVLKSYVSIEEKQDENEVIEELSNMVLDISQNNNLQIYIQKNLEASRITIDKISTTYPKKMGDLVFYQSGNENKVNLTEKSEEYDLNLIEQEEQYYLDLNIDNINCLKDMNVPSVTKVVRFDGTILENLNTKIDDYTYKISFNLNIYDETGKKNVCKVSLDLPNSDLINSGTTIIRQDTSKYVFSVK